MEIGTKVEIVGVKKDIWQHEFNGKQGVVTHVMNDGMYAIDLGEDTFVTHNSHLRKVL